MSSFQFWGFFQNTYGGCLSKFRISKQKYKLINGGRIPNEIRTLGRGWVKRGWRCRKFFNEKKSREKGSGVLFGTDLRVSLHKKVWHLEFLHIFLHSGLIQRLTEEISVFSSNSVRIQTRRAPCRCTFHAVLFIYLIIQIFIFKNFLQNTLKTLNKNIFNPLYKKWSRPFPTEYFKRQKFSMFSGSIGSEQ